MDTNTERILWMDQVHQEHGMLVGEKFALLGELYSVLLNTEIQVPNGFVLTHHVFRTFLEETGIFRIIENDYLEANVQDQKAREKFSQKIQSAILDASFPPALALDITVAYRNLSHSVGLGATAVAIRPAFIPQNGKTFVSGDAILFVEGDTSLISSIQSLIASVFCPENLEYLFQSKISDDVPLLVLCVQLIVHADVGGGGLMYTVDTQYGMKDIIEIDASWGLGMSVTEGRVIPDTYALYKPKIKEGYRPIIKKELGEKRRKFVKSEGTHTSIKEHIVPGLDQELFVLSDDEILKLASTGITIEDFLSVTLQIHLPLRIEWAKDGVTGRLTVLSVTSENITSNDSGIQVTEYSMVLRPEEFAEGVSVGTKILTGKVRKIHSYHRLSDLQEGEILLTESIDTEWESLGQAVAILTRSGGRNSYSAILSRENKIPAILGIGQHAFEKLHTGDEVTIDCSTGSIGRVYSGLVQWTESVTNIPNVPETKTRVSLDVSTLEASALVQQIPNSGVGLLRVESLLSTQIGVHPLALLHFDLIESPTLKRKIERRTVGYENMEEFFVQTLSRGIAQIVVSGGDTTVKVRFSDLRSTEYHSLIAGALYELEESNPVLGKRGVTRHLDPLFAQVFALECQAILRARNEFGLKNIHIVVPFCRTPEEGQEIVNLLENYGLKMGVDGLKIFLMCDTPANVLRADDFLNIFDGFVIDTNELVQLILGLDRDTYHGLTRNHESDFSVRKMIQIAVDACREKEKYVGVCGQALSDYPEFVQYLIQLKVDEVMLSSDALLPIISAVSEEENKLRDSCEDQTSSEVCPIT